LKIIGLLPNINSSGIGHGPVIAGAAWRFISVGNEIIRLGHTFHICIQRKREEMPPFLENAECPSIFREIPEEYYDHLLLENMNCEKHAEKFNCGETWFWMTGGRAWHRLSNTGIRLDWNLLLNNRVFVQYFPRGIIVEGGIDTSWSPPSNLRLGYSERKGGYVRELLAGLDCVELVPLGGHSPMSLRLLYQNIDYFVSWEKIPGWCNMAAEAIACGCAVVTNGINCEPFLDRCIVVKDLRGFFEDPMRQFRYPLVAERLLKIFESQSATMKSGDKHADN